MKMTVLIFVAALPFALACSSSIDLPGSTSTTGTSTATGTGSTGAGAGSGTGTATTSGGGAGSGSTGTLTTSGAGAGSGSTGAGAGSGSTGASVGSSSAGSGSTGSGGMPPSKVCSDCAQLAVEGPCQAAFDACNGSFACTTLLDCHSKCDWTDACNQNCDEIIPSGVAMLKDLIGCIACEQCVLPCADSTLIIYCQ